jgi:hypothetical protein
MFQCHIENKLQFLTSEVLMAVTIKIMSSKMEYSLKMLGKRFLCIISKFL